MTSAKGQRLDFEICFASGEDPEFPARGLENASGQSKGWQSPRFCEYPQEIGIRFTSREVQLNQLQLLSHQSKISQRIELYIGDGPSYETVEWTRLGYMSLDSNEKAQYKAREMKSVFIQAKGAFLKMRLYQCYANSYNLFNQVGVVALNFVGTASRAPPIVRPPVDDRRHRQSPIHPASSKSGNVVVPSPEPSMFDRETAAKLRELRARKVDALSREDYDECKAIKVQEDALRALGSQLAELEAEKRQAVAEEDYDKAKFLKQKMDALRNGESSSLPRRDPPRQVTAYDENKDIVVEGREDVGDDAYRRDDEDRKTQTSVRDDDLPIRSNYAREQQRQPQNEESPFPGTRRSNRPFPGDAGEWSIPGNADVVSSPSSSSFRDAAPPVEEDFGDGPHPLEGVEGVEDLPIAPKLPKGKAMDADIIVRAFGEYVARCSYAKKTWALRKAAIKKAALVIEKPEDSESDRVLFDGALRLLKVASNDRVAHVFLSALELLEKMLDNPPSSMSSRSVVDALRSFMDAIVNRVCTGNSRVQKMAKQTLMELAFHDVVGAAAVSSVALKPLSRKLMRNSKAVVRRLEVLRALLQEHHTTPSAGLGPAPIVQFVKGCKALENRDGSVRDAGAQLIAMCVELHGDSARSHLRGLSKKSHAKVLSLIDGPSSGVPSSENTPSARKRERVPKTSSTRLSSRSRGGDKKARNERSRTGGRARRGGRGGRRGGRGGRRGTGSRRDGRRAVEESSKIADMDLPDMEDEEDEIEAEIRRSYEEETKRRMGESRTNDVPSSSVSSKRSSKLDDADDVDDVEDDDERRDDNDDVAVDDMGDEEGFDDVQPFTCPFCGAYDKAFDDEGLDTHFWKECPMLTSCPKCEQVIEICDLNEHLLEECGHKSECKQCPRCREAIAIAFFEVHTQRRKCLPATDSTVRCPLCHVDIGDSSDPSVDPWRQHLLVEGCPKNPRSLRSY